MDALLTELMTLTHDLRRAHARAATEEERRALRRLTDLASSALDRALLRAGQLAPQRVACDAIAVAATLARDLTDAGVPGVQAPPDAMPLMVGGDPLRIARALRWATLTVIDAATAPPGAPSHARGPPPGAGDVILTCRWHDPAPAAPPALDPDAAALAALLGGGLHLTTPHPGVVQITLALPPPPPIPVAAAPLLAGWTADIIAAPGADMTALGAALTALGAVVRRHATLASVLPTLDPATPTVIILLIPPDPTHLALLRTIAAAAPTPRLILADPSLALPGADPLTPGDDPVALAAAIGAAVRRSAGPSNA